MLVPAHAGERLCTPLRREANGTPASTRPDPDPSTQRLTKLALPPPPPDAEPELDTGGTFDAATEFAELAGNGSYLDGDRRVPPKQHRPGRFTFRRLAGELHEPWWSARARR